MPRRSGLRAGWYSRVSWGLEKPLMRGEQVRLPRVGLWPRKGHTGSCELVFLGNQVFLNIVIQYVMHLPTNQCVRECTRGCVERRTYQVCALPSDFQFGAGVVVVIRYQIHKRLE